MACTDQHNYGSPCKPYKIYGRFGDKDIKIICAYCLEFLAWGEQKPSLQDQRELRGAHIDMLLSGELSDWERSFLKNIKPQNNLSGKQEACYTKIRDKYFSVNKKEHENKIVSYKELDHLF